MRNSRAQLMPSEKAEPELEGGGVNSASFLSELTYKASKTIAAHFRSAERCPVKAGTHGVVEEGR